MPQRDETILRRSTSYGGQGDETRCVIISVRVEGADMPTGDAKLYGVETRRVNEAVCNNPDKFPSDYILN